ncbi:hypothetical protein EVAR_43765_1 [Eumeta japonica]|uniref:Uncharacterized protein n=1 Tax=Eumeta variegata TaxID=151549 RepID=A0A4C1XL56_EUMVA|nr:hypothetical protein EVAR_43765_1 [Eumeta japonica]
MVPFAVREFLDAKSRRGPATRRSERRSRAYFISTINYPACRGKRNGRGLDWPDMEPQDRIIWLLPAFVLEKTKDERSVLFSMSVNEIGRPRILGFVPFAIGEIVYSDRSFLKGVRA